jgi:hypothetical protein
MRVVVSITKKTGTRCMFLATGNLTLHFAIEISGAATGLLSICVDLCLITLRQIH